MKWYMSCAVLSCAVLSCPVLSCPVLSCPVLSCPVLSCPVLSCPVLSCPVLSCPVLSCPVLSCPVLSSKQLLQSQRSEPVRFWTSAANFYLFYVPFLACSMDISTISGISRYGSRKYLCIKNLKYLLGIEKNPVTFYFYSS